jgi:signal transduction histidine kinase
MLQNLLSNAVKYSPRGGEVRVSARAGPGGLVELAVEDQGVGIAAEALPRVFDKYVRIANPETASVRGLGLGLSLVRALAEAHGGRIEVSSEPGKGSCFRLLLPGGGEDFSRYSGHLS